MKLNETEKQETHRVLAYGRSKVGKTALVGQLARKYKVHWFDLEDGIGVLRNPAILPVEFQSNVDVIRLPDSQTATIAIETLLKVFKKPFAERRICWYHGKIDCPACGKDSSAPFAVIDLSKFTKEDVVVLDSVTQLSNSAMFAIIKDKLQGDTVDDFVRATTPSKDSFQIFRAQGFLLDRIFGNIQASGVNFCAISHEQMIEQNVDQTQKEDKPVGDGKEIIVPVAGTRNFSRNFARYFDSVVYLAIVNNRHRAYSSTVYDGNIVLGSRTGIDISKAGESGNPTFIDLFERNYNAAGGAKVVSTSKVW
jgi:hypothetical protein